MLIDDVTIRIKAGDGGRGSVSFNKNLMALGPAGGDGGDGGSVYFEGISDLNALAQFRHKKVFFMKHGEYGRGQFKDGADGEDLILKVPVGTVIHIVETGESQEIMHTKDRVLAAKGGLGGRGNFKFRSPTNTSPTQFQVGTPGEAFTIRLELKLIADVGLVGMPNAGKSSLLNELTGARSKVANYPFTTLEPSLGAYYELILADIPGLIEGASHGKGLGIKFLKHIERTKTIFHLISAESEDLVRDYKIIRKELETYSKELAKKPEYVFLSKSDMIPPKEMKAKIAAVKKLNKDAIAISIHDEDALEKVKGILNKIKAEK
ncbi:MAG: GTPase ObgE [Candidatus Azambacteria bacterium]|nr:GTPase ObgE [Candidatus Azambacteria bacterium]